MPFEKSLLTQQCRINSIANRKNEMFVKNEKTGSVEGGNDNVLIQSPKRTNKVAIVMKSSY